MINLSKDELVKIAVAKENAVLLKGGALSVTTGKYTGRSPDAKFIVKDKLTQDTIDWKNNKSMTLEEWKLFKMLFFNFLNNLTSKQNIFVQQVRAGGDKDLFLNVEISTSFAWHSIFAKNMFLKTQIDNFKPDWKLFYIPEFQEEPRVIINFSENLILITGTSYAGEMKKSVFTVLNYIYPQNNSLPMHCSVNTDLNGNNPAIFFGLSGTGKTTLSADITRILLGDDEHGWTSSGLSNFEGGCYAKTIRLDAKAEPQIWKACQKKGAILENVVIENNIPNFDSDIITENTRASYPIEFIDNSSKTPFIELPPKNIIMLTCDAFGVLPPVALLNPKEAKEFFLLGYTAKVAGTERGITEPRATFSSCFGLPFMPKNPKIYADLLERKINESNANCWLVNTGWTGGEYGIGKRIPIGVTRRIVEQILNNNLINTSFMPHKYTRFKIPANCDFIPKKILNPELGWNNLEEYKNKANFLLELFKERKSKL